MEIREIIGNTTATPNPRPDWTQTDEAKADYIKNKPRVLTENEIIQLIVDNAPDDQVQSDWTQVDETKKDYIKNKPEILTEEEIVQLIVSNSPDDQIQADWEQTDKTKKDYIKNKPEFGIIAMKDEAGVNKLYLTRNNEIIGNGVTLLGGGDSTSSIIITNNSGWISKTISKGDSCPISLSWSFADGSGSFGNGVLKVVVNGVTKITKEVEQGDVSIDVSSYLASGINTIQIVISDVFGDSRSITFSVTTVSISISSYFDDKTTYTGDIPFSYKPVGAVEKTVYFLVDGKEIGKIEGLTVSGREQPYTIPAQAHGSHTIEVYFTAEIDSNTVESNHLFYDIICTEDGNTTPIIVSEFRATTVKQYETVNISYRVYTPGTNTSEVQLKDGDNVVSELTVDRTRKNWPYKASTAGTKNLSIVCGDTIKHISFTVAEGDIKVDAETANLELYLNAANRSNDEANPLEWKSGDVSASLTGFNFKSDGWQSDEDGNTVLRVSGNARVTVPFNIFGTDFRRTGKTIEIEFATRNVMNYDAVILSCWNDNRGIEITAQKARLKSEQSEVFTQYKENEHIRISFSVEKSAENRLLAIYINGIMSGVVQYPDDDDFSQSSPVGISIGSSECTVDIYNIRIYSNNLTRYQIMDNWIADTQDINVLTERYNRNNVFDDYGNISMAKLPNYIPYFIVNAMKYENLPQSKGDKKTVSGSYVDPLHSERNFAFEGAEIDVQGTSSATYPRKNYKVKFKNGFVINGEAVDKYQLRPTSMPTDVFTFKADVASSEGANNVELVMLYEDACPVKTPPQQIDSRVRQGIEGYPCLMFYYDGTNHHFIGKYNFNNDKSTEEVFGFEDGDESWEILLNTTEMAVWKDDDFTGDGWKSTFEGRYPDKSTNIENLKELATWLKSTDTTAVDSEEEKAARLEKFKTEFANWFNKDAMLFNYIFTELFLMVDNRAKNAFPTRYDEDGKWLVLPYDYDSAIGINNEGELVFGYELEDIDIIGEDYVYNGQESVLYVNIRLAFADEIMAMYQSLRSNGILSYEEVERRFEEHQNVWGEAIFNEDARFKYIDPLVNDGDSTYLSMLQGSKAEQRKWWLYNRFRYMDSKYEAGDSMTDFIKLRTYGVADIDVTPYADIYASTKYDSFMVKKRALRKDGTVTLENPLAAGRDADVIIYSASQLSSVGDLSGLKVGQANFSAATRLSSLKVGDGTEGYENPNLTNLTVGNLTLLKELDARNCTNLKQSVDLSGCPNIENVYLEGTGVTGVSLPNGGILKTLHIPATVTALQIMNQKHLTDFSMPSYENISTLRLENPNAALNVKGIVEKIKEKSRVRLIGIDCSFDDIYKAIEFCEKLDTFRGLDENGGNLDNVVVSGKIHIGKATEDILREIESKYPDIRVTYDTIANAVVFVVDGKVVSTQFLNAGEAIVKPNDPAGVVTPEYIRSFKGWSLDGETVATVPSTMGNSSLTFTALFNKTMQSYRIQFINIDNTVLASIYCKYGSVPTYPESTDPMHPYFGNLKFLGWEPDLVAVTGDAEYIATYEAMSKTRALLMRAITEFSNDYILDIGSWAFYGCGQLANINIPSVKNIGSYAFGACKALTNISLPSVINIADSAFRDCYIIESIDLPLVESIGEYAFCQSMTNNLLTIINLPSLTHIGRNAFGNFANLTTVNLPSVTTIGYSAFSYCRSLQTVRLPATPPTLERIDAFNGVPTTCVFYIPRGSLAAYQSATNWSSLTSTYTFTEEDRE